MRSVHLADHAESAAHRALALVCVLGVSQAHADIYSVEATGTIVQFGASYGGADQYPFLGLSDGDPLLFHFEYDTGMAPTAGSVDSLATYEFSTTDAFVRLGATTVTLDRVRIVVGTTDSGFGFMRFWGFRDDLGFDAGFLLNGNTPIPGSLPTAIDLQDFTFIRESSANSALNNLLLPIVYGSVDAVTVTPTPGVPAALLLAGGVLARRRR